MPSRGARRRTPRTAVDPGYSYRTAMPRQRVPQPSEHELSEQLPVGSYVYSDTASTVEIVSHVPPSRVQVRRADGTKTTVMDARILLQRLADSAATVVSAEEHEETQRRQARWREEEEQRRRDEQERERRRANLERVRHEPAPRGPLSTLRRFLGI